MQIYIPDLHVPLTSVLGANAALQTITMFAFVILMFSWIM